MHVRRPRRQYVVLARRYDSNAPGVRESCKQRRSISFSALSVLACRPKVENKPAQPSASWRKASGRKAEFSAGARLRLPQAPASLGQPAALAALAGHVGLAFDMGACWSLPSRQTPCGCKHKA